MDPITDELIEDFLEVRDSGECNMFDYKCVQFVANDLELYELVIWIEDNGRRNYGKLLEAVNDYLS